jgi:hypothetical protein
VRVERFAELREYAENVELFDASVKRAQAHLEQCSNTDCGIFLVEEVVELRWTSAGTVVNITFHSSNANMYVYDRQSEEIIYDATTSYEGNLK